MPLTANEQLQDALVRHQIGLQRHGTSIQQGILELLDATERDIVELLRRRGERLVGRAVQDSVTKTRLQTLLGEIREIRSRAMSAAFAHWRKSLQELVRSEAQYMARAVQTVAPVQLNLLTPEPRALAAIVTTQPFEGALLSEWARRLATADMQRISSAIQVGMVRGDTTAQMARALVGTTTARGANGVTALTRQHALSITRTAVQTFSQAARQQVVEANRKVFSQERYVATLDGRTTPICRSLDGQLFKIGEGPQPPLHWQCRSTRVPFIDPKLAGERPARTATQRQLLRDYTRENGLERVTSRGDLPRGHRSSFDTFARRQLRAQTGTVPAATTYQQFLARQSAAFQDDVLGVTRGRLFRRGELTLDRFVDRSGRQYTLPELARREADAFRRAGLDPDDFT